MRIIFTGVHLNLGKTHQLTQKSRAPYLFGLATAVLFFIVGVLTLPSYGYTWDTPENLLTGEHYVRFFQTGDGGWLDFAAWDEHYFAAGAERPLLHNREFNAPFRYPPVANMTAVLTHQLFSQQLGWLTDPDGYHVSVLLFAALLVFVLAVFTWQAFGPLAGFAATLSLVTYPLFFEHAHNNLKDVPFSALVFLSLWSYWQGNRYGRGRWFILSAIAAGCALGVRILSLEIWLVLGAAYLPSLWSNRHQKWGALRPYKPFLYHLPLALLIFFVLWPWLWPDPLGRLGEHLAFGQDVSRGLRVLYAGQLWQSGVTLPWHYTAVIFLYTTPILLLLGGLVGGVTAVKRSLKQQDVAALILLTLFVVSLLRSSLPTIPQYDGTRHMLEGIVAFIGLFGLGVQIVWLWLRGRWPRPLPTLTPYLLTLLLFLPFMYTNSQLHPFQGIFYNRLAGGTTAVVNQYPQEYWGSSFRLGTEWLNQNLEPDTVILPRVGGHLVRYYLDDRFTRIPDEAIPNLPPEQPITIIYMNRPDKFDPIAQFSNDTLEPVYELSRGNVPVLKIVQTDAQTLQQSPP